MLEVLWIIPQLEGWTFAEGLQSREEGGGGPSAGQGDTLERLGRIAGW